ncbi:probable cytochrome P450 28a5 isoform X2 [Tribolium madens]|uniref:probable cytochrome P450 28a5 isoform X2 n=1 Tax=Tribolium madens TaxID=41895 RepID=UPI001CF73A4D|nr:probable cytochrome P450 28a5 isoform X2 [Tribolium madens]
MILLLLILTIITGIYFLNLNYQYWKKRGVPGPKPKFFVGNMLENFLVKKSPAEVFADIYRQYENAPLVGIFRGFSPALLIRDPELIRDITVKSFQQFHDNDLFLDKDVDPLLGRNPFFAKGDEWKTHRTVATPGFTSGKMKTIYPLLEHVSQEFIKYVEKVTKNGACHVKNVCMRFTLNNVGSCAFGIEAKCFEEENNEFKQIADRFFAPEDWQNIKVFIISILPFLAKLISIKFTPKDVEEKLTNIVVQILKYREDNNIVRNDFLQILHQIKKKDPNFTNVDITAHAAGFFGDGYETSSIVMHFILYALASNPQTQSKLREEVTKAFEENHDSLPYEELQKLQYLDAVFNEALRLYPPLGALIKVCTKPYTYTPKNGEKPFVIEPETRVILPLIALHRDPKYFEEPDSFKPERFLVKENITKYTFMPFGEGPRACLGQRFGTLQVKVGVAYVIKNFEISVNERTKLPLEFEPTYFLVLPKDPIWLDFKKIV